MLGKSSCMMTPILLYNVKMNMTTAKVLTRPWRLISFQNSGRMWLSGLSMKGKPITRHMAPPRSARPMLSRNSNDIDCFDNQNALTGEFGETKLLITCAWAFEFQDPGRPKRKRELRKPTANFVAVYSVQRYMRMEPFVKITGLSAQD